MICKKCLVDKARDEFPTYSNKTADGLRHGLRKKCKACYNAEHVRTFVDTSCPSCGKPMRVRTDTHRKTGGKCQSCAKLLSSAGKVSPKLKDEPSYKRWLGMRARCAGRSAVCKARYADRGITVCHEWEHNPWNFVRWAKANGFSDELSLDRIDNDAGYSPANCRWVSSTVQARNTSNNRLVVIDNDTIAGSLAEAAELLSVSQDRIYKALKHNWKCVGHDIQYLSAGSSK